VFSLEWEDLFFDLSQLLTEELNALVQQFIWKHNVYKQMRRGIILGKERALEVGRVALIKSLIYTRKKECT